MFSSRLSRLKTPREMALSMGMVAPMPIQMA